MRHTTSNLGLVGLLLASACTGALDPGGGTGGTPPMDPPPADVQIVVSDGFVPQANVRVIFQNADGTTLSEATTDAGGLATADMPDGGNLTVIRTFPQPTPPDPPRPAEVYTYVGVQPGDRLQLGHATSDATPAAINVVVPDTAQGTVKVVTACGSGEGTAPNVPITVTGCPAQLDFYVMDGSGAAFIAHAAYAPSVDLSHEVLQGRLTTTLSATNLPANASVSVEERILSGTFELYSSGPKRVDGGPASVNVPNVQGVDKLAVTTVASDGGTQLVARRSSYAATPTIVDASTGLIPYVSAPDLAPTGISWLEQGAGSADFVLVTLDVTRGGAQGGTTPNDAEYLRAVIAPHAGTSLQLPMLSGADAIYNPTAADQIAGVAAIGAMTGGYAAARAGAFAVPDLGDAAPMDGVVTLSYAGGTPPGF